MKQCFVSCQFVLVKSLLDIIVLFYENCTFVSRLITINDLYKYYYITTLLDFSFHSVYILYDFYLYVINILNYFTVLTKLYIFINHFLDTEKITR